jgi:hypothetical protein
MPRKTLVLFSCTCFIGCFNLEHISWTALSWGYIVLTSNFVLIVESASKDRLRELEKKESGSEEEQEEGAENEVFQVRRAEYEARRVGAAFDRLYERVPKTLTNLGLSLDSFWMVLATMTLLVTLIILNVLRSRNPLHPWSLYLHGSFTSMMLYFLVLSWSIAVVRAVLRRRDQESDQAKAVLPAMKVGDEGIGASETNPQASTTSLKRKGGCAEDGRLATHNGAQSQAIQAKLQRNLANAQADAGRLRSRLKGLDVEIATRRAEETKLKSETRQLRTEAAIRKEETARLRAEVSTRDCDLARLQVEVERASTRLEMPMEARVLQLDDDALR